MGGLILIHHALRIQLAIAVCQRINSRGVLYADLSYEYYLECGRWGSNPQTLPRVAVLETAVYASSTTSAPSEYQGGEHP